MKKPATYNFLNWDKPTLNTRSYLNWKSMKPAMEGDCRGLVGKLTKKSMPKGKRKKKLGFTIWQFSQNKMNRHFFQNAKMNGLGE